MAVKDDALATALAALSSPTRLAILRALRAPRALGEIHVRSSDADARPLARQTIREHLDKLIGVGMVTSREVDRPYGDTVEFVANHQTLYALTEELRNLSRVRPLVEPDGQTAHTEAPQRTVGRGGTLVLVKGLDEGTTFELRPPPGSARAEWIVGRRRGVAVPLDFDPYVSSENSRVVWEGGAYAVEDIPDSRNGTSLNFAPLPRGERRPLRHGDVIGVGRCLLLFWA